MPDISPENIDAEFGRVLQYRRRRAGFTQAQFASRAGLHAVYISQLERGLKSPSLRTLAAIALALKCKPSTLLRATEGASPSYAPR